MPVNVTTAPTSVRPCVNTAVSAATSNASLCSRTAIASSPRHRRKECDLACAGDRRIGLYVYAVNGGANDLGIGECMRVFVSAPREPGNELADRSHTSGRIDL